MTGLVALLPYLLAPCVLLLWLLWVSIPLWEGLFHRKSPPFFLSRSLSCSSSSTCESRRAPQKTADQQTVPPSLRRDNEQKLAHGT